MKSLTFQSTQFDIADHNGQPWLRLPQIGVALGYANQYHAQKLYQKHAAEFTDSMTAVVRLPTAGGEQEVRIFSLRGAHLLGMFARTAKAQEFRRWVLDVLEKETAPKVGAGGTALPPFDLRATMLAGNSTPTTPLPPAVQAALNRKAWAMAGSAYDLCREFLARRVAWTCEIGQPRMIDELRALGIIAETTLDMALAPEHYNKVHGILLAMEVIADTARCNLAKMRAKLKQEGLLQ